jgi:type I restriction enzyme S subunit
MEEGVRVIRLQNIGVGDFVDDDKAYIAPSHFAELKKHECVPGDVLIGTLGDPNLRACIQPSTIPQALNKADCVQARVSVDRATPDYVTWLLNMPSTIYLAPGIIHGETRSRISMGQLAVLPVPVPPLPLQQKFAAIVRRFERLRAQQREAERQAEHLFQTLLHRAFSGGL